MSSVRHTPDWTVVNRQKLSNGKRFRAPNRLISLPPHEGLGNFDKRAQSLEYEIGCSVDL